MLPSVFTALLSLATSQRPVAVNAGPVVESLGQTGNGGAGGVSSSPFVLTRIPTRLTSSSQLSGRAVAIRADNVTACNNSPDLCNRAYNNVTYMGAHDSAFLRDANNGYSIAGNQYFNATVALDAGIRLLQAQVHNSNGTLQLCHSLCAILDAGTLAAWLTKIRVWIDANPNEVVTLLLVNSDNMDADSFGAAFDNAGLAKYGYVPTGITASAFQWPTLQEMITKNTRLVTFIANTAPSSVHPYLLNEFDYVFETAYAITNLAGFNCTLDRPTSVASASAALSSGMLPLLNHFAYQDLGSGVMIPAVDNVTTTNSPGTSMPNNLGLHAQTCNKEWAKKPTFMLVDFYDKGPSLDTADTLNGVTNPVGRKSSKSGTSTSGAMGDAARRGSAFGVAMVMFLAAALVAL